MGQSMIDYCKIGDITYELGALGNTRYYFIMENKAGTCHMKGHFVRDTAEDARKYFKRVVKEWNV